MAHSGHAFVRHQCPILGTKRTLPCPASLGPIYEYTPFCNGPRQVNPSFASSDRRALASVRGRLEAAT